MAHVSERPALRTLSPLLALALLAGCAGSTAGPAAEPAAVPAPEAPDFADLDRPFAPAAAGRRHATPGGDGWALFASTCGGCHTLLPPAKAAPPMAVVMRRYALVYPRAEDTRAAMVFWVRNAKAEWSAMPRGAIEEHGVMPALDLPVEQVERIVDYLLGLKVEGSADRG